MVTWDLSPAIAAIGPFELRWYGLVYALGFTLAWWALRKEARAGRIPNLTEKLAEDYTLLLIMGSIIGARLAYVLLYNPAYYWNHLLEVPAVWQGGLSIHGAIIGGTLLTWFWTRKQKINPYQVLDTLVLPLALSLVFGRLANYANGELWGTVTAVSWCVVFPHVDNLCRHPSQLYESLYSLGLFLVLLGVSQWRRLAPGVLFWAFIGLYGLARFLVTFTRALDPTDPGLLGLSIGQWLSLSMIAVALWWFNRVRRSGHPLTRT